ncbi:MAG: Flp family type IVb pilin [Methylococcales bacterium]|nr:Flp family type IVb pilin [Methylococcales bacterium]MDD5633088.1 Flp family type IVb pilin [Methylococcales bacterium]
MKKSFINPFNKNLMSTRQKGATMVEYAIMVALIAIVAITAVTILGQKVSGTFNSVASSLPG